MRVPIVVRPSHQVQRTLAIDLIKKVCHIFVPFLYGNFNYFANEFGCNILSGLEGVLKGYSISLLV